MTKPVYVNRWGYHPVEDAKIFTLLETEGLPDGWQDSPAKVERVELKDTKEDAPAVSMQKAQEEAGLAQVELAKLQVKYDEATAEMKKIAAEGNSYKSVHTAEFKATSEAKDIAVAQVLELTKELSDAKAENAVLISDLEKATEPKVAVKLQKNDGKSGPGEVGGKPKDKA